MIYYGSPDARGILSGWILSTVQYVVYIVYFNRDSSLYKYCTHHQQYGSPEGISVCLDSVHVQCHASTEDRRCTCTHHQQQYTVLVYRTTAV